MMKIYSLVLLALLLSACATAHHDAQATWDIRATHYLNPDENGQSKPIALTFYQLKNSQAFKQASYVDLSEHAPEILGEDLIDKQTMTVRPGQHTSLQKNLAVDTQYIGIVAAYRDIDHAHWRQVLIVKPHYLRHSRIDLAVQAAGMTASIR